MEATDKRHLPPGYQLFMLVLCLYALGVLATEALVDINPQTRTILDGMDYLICALFFIDFVLCMARAPNRWRYFFLELGCIDLVSCIPSANIARLGRATRILRIFRVLRGFKATRILAMMVLNRRKENTFLAVGLVTILLVVFSSMAILHLETEPDSKIKTAQDAIWWAVATVSTVG